jgi:siroheme synthase-like protein
MSWDYPVFLNLEGRRCLVIGNSWSTPGKVLGLVDARADVTVLAPEAAVEVQALAARGAVRWERRDYRAGDLEGFFLAVSTHDDKSRNEPIWQEALSRNILFNAVDDPPRCGFTYPSIHRQGDLAIALSTNGKCPAVGVRLRQRLEREIGPEYGSLVQLLGELRQEIAACIPDFESRKELWYRLVDSSALEQIREGDVAAARATLHALLESAVRCGRLEPALQTA